VVGKGINEALQMEEKMGEVRHGPKSSGDSATDADERSREGEGRLRRTPKGEWGWEGKKGAAVSGCAPF
jgi:hypothetical protein